MKYLDLLWKIIKESSIKKMELADIFTKDYENSEVNSFFASLKSEVCFDEYNLIERYTKYIDYIYKAFENSFEYTGGKRIRFYHSMYVAILAKKLADKLEIIGADKEIAILSALFHDIGKSNKIYNKKGNDSFKEFEKKHNIDHEKLGSEMVFDILKNDLPISKIEKISNVIIDKNYDEISSKILHDADNMSELGRIEIYRSFYYNCLDGTDIDFTIKYWYDVNSIIKMKKINSSKINIAKDMMLEKIKIVFDIYDKYRN